MATYLGIEIGGTKLQLVLGDEHGKIVQRIRRTVDKAKGALGIRQQIEAAIPELTGRQSRPQAVGVGFGGPVDWQTGAICRSHQIEGWSEFDFAGWLRRTIDVPVFLDNDANVAALGEATYGAGQGCNPVFYVTLGSGVGGGLVVDGAIYHGASPGEAEIGHVLLDRNGTKLEERCSGWAIDGRIRAAARQVPDSVLARSIAGAAEGGEAQHLAAAWREQDAVAQKILSDHAEDLAFGLSHVVHLFHPQIIVLGGGLSSIGEPLRAGVEATLRRFIMKAFLPGPRIVLAQLGEDAVPVGALELAKQGRTE
jgi:glucokinase